CKDRYYIKGISRFLYRQISGRGGEVSHSCEFLFHNANARPLIFGITIWEMTMELEQLMPHVEALIFASERPITQIELTEVVGQALETPIEADRSAAFIEAIREKYEAPFYPFQLKEAGGGFQFLTKKAYHKTVLQLNGDKHIKKLS